MQEKMDDFVFCHVEEVFYLMTHSAEGNITNEVIKRTMTDALKVLKQRPAGKSNAEFLTALIEGLRSDTRFCEERKGFFINIRKIMENFLFNLVEGGFDLIADSPGGYVTNEMIKGLVTDMLETQRLPADMFDEEFLTDLFKESQHYHYFCEEIVDDFSCIEEVFDLIADSAKGHVSHDVIKRMVTNAHRIEELPAVLKELRWDRRFCEDKKGFQYSVQEKMDYFVRCHVEEVFDLMTHSAEGNITNEVIKRTMTDALKVLKQRPAGKSNAEFLTALIEGLRSDTRFCEERKGFFINMRKVMDNCLFSHVEGVFDLIADSHDGYVTYEMIKEMVTDMLETQQLRAGKFEKQCLTNLFDELQRYHYFCEDRNGFSNARKDRVHSSHWTCMHAFCKRRFESKQDFENHLNDSNHCGGKINKNVIKLCYKKLFNTGIAQTAASVCTPDHELQESSTNNLTVSSHGRCPSLKELNNLLSDDLNMPKGLQDEIGGMNDEILAPLVDADNVDDVGDDTSPNDSMCDGRIIQYLCSTPSLEVSRKGYMLADHLNAPNFHECALVGQLIAMSKLDNENQVQEQDQKVYLNTHEPFCLVTVGVQGSGKSHTLATVLEGCLIQFPVKSVCRLEKPMTTLVLHYDENETSRCEVRYRTIIILLFSSSDIMY